MESCQKAIKNECTANQVQYKIINDFPFFYEEKEGGEILLCYEVSCGV